MPVGDNMADHASASFEAEPVVAVFEGSEGRDAPAPSAGYCTQRRKSNTDRRRSLRERVLLQDPSMAMFQERLTAVMEKRGKGLLEMVPEDEVQVPGQEPQRDRSDEEFTREARSFSLIDSLTAFTAWAGGSASSESGSARDDALSLDDAGHEVSRPWRHNRRDYLERRASGLFFVRDADFDCSSSSGSETSEQSSGTTSDSSLAVLEDALRKANAAIAAERLSGVAPSASNLAGLRLVKGEVDYLCLGVSRDVEGSVTASTGGRSTRQTSVSSQSSPRASAIAEGIDYVPRLFSDQSSTGRDTPLESCIGNAEGQEAFDRELWQRLTRY